MTSRLVLIGVPEDIADLLRRFLEQLVEVEQESSDVFNSSGIDLSLLDDILHLPKLKVEQRKELEKEIENLKTRIEDLEAIQPQEIQEKNGAVSSRQKDPEDEGLSKEAYRRKIRAAMAILGDIQKTTESIQDYTQQAQSLFSRKEELT